MNLKSGLNFIVINLLVAFAVATPSLPGPSLPLVLIIRNAGQLVAMLGFILVPVGIIWFFRSLKRISQTGAYDVSKRAVILITIPVTLFLVTFIAADHLLSFSRLYAIERSNELVSSIEKYKTTTGRYPHTLSELAPAYIATIPSPGVMGIDQYHYTRTVDSYTLSFRQDVLLGFNFEVVTYNPHDTHIAEGKTKTIYDTGKPHWKYYIFD